MPRSTTHYRRLSLETLERRLPLASSASSFAAPATFIESAQPEAMLVDESITINGQAGGRIFDGIGGVSASSSRLLFDYPEPQRSEILDYLFKPNYGAGIQILKVEIGSDVNSTTGAEPSHMRAPTDLNYDRGFEWWLMKEARARNPEIILAALEWGAPGWFEGGFWSQDNIDYIVSWLDGAAQHGLTIDYVGGWNESGYDIDWFIALDQALAATHPDVKIIAADDLPRHNWRIADDMLNNAAFRTAVDVLGQHSPGGWRTEYKHYSSTPEAIALGKPLWTSEQSALSHDVGPAPWARAINRAYIDARITASLNWAPVSSWYSNLPLADTGLMLAQTPWSGYYQLGSMIWVYAHTTQFAEPGWQYVTSASGYLESGASYVTLKSPNAFDPDGRDFSIVIEAMDVSEASTVQFSLTGGLSLEPVHVWSSNLANHDLADDFLHQQTIAHSGVITLTLEPGHIYTVSSTSGQRKGDAQPASTNAEQLPLPFFEDFEDYEVGQLARYFADLNGGFEVVSAGGAREGLAYRQMVTQQPIRWNLAGAGSMAPTTMFGDPRWWGDYELKTDVFLEQPGSIELIGRIAAQAGQRIAGYHLSVESSGAWRLYSQELTSIQSSDLTLATGMVSFPVDSWHTVALRMKGSEISVVINGEVVGSVIDSRHTTGNVALRAGAWQTAQFDNVAVTPTAEAPNFVPQQQMALTATSEHDFFYRGDVYPARYAIDGRPESFWHTRFNPRVPLPQSLTLDLGAVREVEGLTYQPRLDNNRNGMITRYNVSLSHDGETFTPVITDAQWPRSTATKIASWAPQDARYVRLEATAASGGDMATAGEINIMATAPDRLSGDYNDSGIVDAADYIVWRRSVGQKIPHGSGADGSGDGSVDAADYNVWRSHFGETHEPHFGTPPASAAGSHVSVLRADEALPSASQRVRWPEPPAPRAELQPAGVRRMHVVASANSIEPHADTLLQLAIEPDHSAGQLDGEDDVARRLIDIPSQATDATWAVDEVFDALPNLLQWQLR